MMQTVMRDLRYAARQLRNSPSFTVAAILTLALGVGATTAIFSCVYGLLLKSLPFESADRLVTLQETHPQLKGPIEATYPDYQDWQKQQKRLHPDRGLLHPESEHSLARLRRGHSEQIHRVLASGNFFAVLGISPLAGRLIDQQDDIDGKDHVAVLSASAWQRLFSRDPGVVGRNIELSGSSYTVIGVLPPQGSFPAEGDVWLPLSLLDKPTQASRVWHSVNALGRLRPGVSLPQAQADMRTIAQHLEAAYPATNRKVGVSLELLREQLVGALPSRYAVPARRGGVGSPGRLRERR
jgi:hypothetical protein